MRPSLCAPPAPARRIPVKGMLEHGYQRHAAAGMQEQEAVNRMLLPGALRQPLWQQGAFAIPVID